MEAQGELKDLIDQLGKEFTGTNNSGGLHNALSLAKKLKEVIKGELAKGNVSNAKELEAKLYSQMSKEETAEWMNRLSTLYGRNDKN